MDAAQVIDAISRAFPLEPVPETGLYQTHAADQLYFRDITEQQAETFGAKDAGRHWQAYRDEEIRSLNLAMAHQPPEGFVYYLPAYLCSAIRELQSLGDDHDMIVTHAVGQVSDRKPYDLSRYTCLSAAQRQPVVAFLEFVAASGDQFNTPLARKALDRFWLRYATSPADSSGSGY